MGEVPILLIFVVVWIGIGLATALWMARRGHRDPGWLFMAVVFGPILAAVAGERIQRRPRRLARLEAGRRGSGRVRVLVGVDGSAESREALRLAVELFGDHAESMVVAEVVDYDASEDDWRGRTVEAKQRLSDLAGEEGRHSLTCEVLAGPPAQTLRRLAQDEGVDVVVVGRHGRGLSKRLLGNVAWELVQEGTVPVLVAGGRRDAAERGVPG